MGKARVMGIGGVTIRFRGKEKAFQKGEEFGIEELQWPFLSVKSERAPSPRPSSDSSISEKEGPFWERIHSIEEAFRDSLAKNDREKATKAILDLDRVIWDAERDLEEDEFITQARELMRESILLLGLGHGYHRDGKERAFAGIVDSLLELRETLRKEGNWRISDQIREALSYGGIVVEDTRDGPRWRLKD